MSPNNPSAPAPLSPPSTLPPAAKKTRWLLYGCGTLVALLLVIVATVLITLWWMQRPIKPVVLSAPEKAAVEAKLQHLGAGKAPASSSSTAPGPNRTTTAGAPTYLAAAEADANPGQDRTYVPGSKVLRLTERETDSRLAGPQRTGSSADSSPNTPRFGANGVPPVRFLLAFKGRGDEIEPASPARVFSRASVARNLSDELPRAG